MLKIGGKALKRLGFTPEYRTLSNSEYRSGKLSSQSAGDKLRWREGNTHNGDVGLEAAII